MDRSALSVSTLGEPRSDLAYWLSRTPEERFEAIELLRMIQYGYNPLTDRLERVLTVAQRGAG
jgi:hypothetical protein